VSYPTLMDILYMTCCDAGYCSWTVVASFRMTTDIEQNRQKMVRLLGDWVITRGKLSDELKLFVLSARKQPIARAIFSISELPALYLIWY